MFKMNLGCVAAMVTALAAMSGAVFAEDIGKEEFKESCAACHGEQATGDGPIAGLLSINVPDLTTLAQRNNGVFPTVNVVHIIDGRSDIRGHGSEMPVWGDRFRLDAADVVQNYGELFVVRGRILSIVYYLESIQK